MLLKTEPRILELVKELFDADWNQITHRHLERRMILRGGPRAGFHPKNFAILTDIISSLRKFPPHIKVIDAFDFKVFIFEGLAWGVIGYSVGSFIEMIIFDSFRLLDPMALALKGVVLGLGTFAVWTFLAAFFFQRSSRLVPLLSDLFLMSAVCFTLAGPQLMTDLNSGLDKSTPDIVTAHIVNKFSETKHRSRGRTSTSYYLQLNIENNHKYHISEKMNVPAWEYWNFESGQRIDIQVRQGFFKSPYIAEIELNSSQNAPVAQVTEQVTPSPLPVPAPSASVPAPTPTLSSMTEEKRQNIIAAIKWRPEKPMSYPAIKFRELKYDSKRVRSIEPLVNDQLNGLASYWYENGQSYGAIPWLNGQKHGRFTTFRKDGSRHSELSYKNGKPHGLLSWFDKDGKLIDQRLYIDGEIQNVPKEEINRLTEKFN